MKILVAEDELVSQRLLQKMLSGYGEVDVAADGKEAIGAFLSAMEKARPYDLIFLDIMMPEMDGQEALKEIRKIEADIGLHGSSGVKIIMTTAFDDKKNVMEAFKFQCDAYLVKPIDKTQLEDQLQSLGFLE